MSDAGSRAFGALQTGLVSFIWGPYDLSTTPVNFHPRPNCVPSIIASRPRFVYCSLNGFHHAHPKWSVADNGHVATIQQTTEICVIPRVQKRSETVIRGSDSRELTETRRSITLEPLLALTHKSGPNANAIGILMNIAIPVMTHVLR